MQKVLQGHYVFGSSRRPYAVRPSVNTYFAWRDISLYLVVGFQWHLSQIFTTWLEIALKVFKVRGQRSRSQRGQMHFSRRGIPINLLPSARCAYTDRRCGVEDQLCYHRNIAIWADKCEWINEWMNECMNEWISECASTWVIEWMREWISE